MRFSNLTYLFFLPLASCQNMGSAPSQQAIVAVRDAEDDTLIQEEPNDTVINTAKAAQHRLDFIEEKMTLPGAYRIWEEADDLALKMKGEWLEIILDRDKLIISPLTPTFEDGFDPCAGVKTKALQCQNNSLMAAQIAMLKQGVYKATKLMNDRVWPKDKVDFTFQGQSYQLQGLGDITETEIISNEDDKEELFHAVSHYELQLVDAKGHRITLVNEESFHDTFIQIKFVGDLDGDDKPDFIISAPRNYEEARILLILSTDMQQETIRVYEASRQFDC